LSKEKYLDELPLREETLADQPIRQIRRNLFWCNEFAWGEVNKLIWRTKSFSYGITTERNETAFRLLDQRNYFS